MPKTTRALSAAGIAATLVNFPVVFVGLVAITSQTAGDDEVAMLNLWAVWGIALGLLGQVGLISGVLDHRGWTSGSSLRMAVVLGFLGATLGIVARNTLFPSHGSWWVAPALIAAAVYLIGRQRAELTLRSEGSIALVVTALENTVRTAAVLIILLVGFDSADDLRFGATAIVAPFTVSLALIWQLLNKPGEPGAVVEATPSKRVGGPIAAGILAGVPALAAYAIVPGLTLLDTTSDLDAFAIASSLLRGPLLIASFAAPWLLQVLLADTTRRGESLWYVPAGVTALQLVVGLALDTTFTVELIVHAAFSSVVAASAYLSILRSADRIEEAHRPIAALAAALAAFSVVLLIATEADRVHPFLALSTACAIVPMALHTMSPGRTRAIA